MKGKTVDGVAAGIWPAVKNFQQSLIPARIEHLHLHKHFELAEHVEGLGERGNGLAVCERHRGEVTPPRLRNRPAEHGRVVMDDDLAVDRGVDVELHAVGSPAGRRPEGGQGGLQRDAGGAPMSGDEGLYCWRLSALFRSVQSRSFSM